MIQFENLSKTFKNGVVGVRQASGSFDDSGIHLIMGHSGSGKTTLLQMIALLQRPTQGTIMVDGSNVLEMSEKEHISFRRDHFGFVFQSFLLQDKLTALENVMLPMLAKQTLSFAEMQEKGEHLLEIVHLKERMQHCPPALSGGEQQRVAIARALANNPKYIFADEPTGNLDQESENSILELFRTLSEQRCIVIVSHNPVTESYAKQIFDMTSGELSVRGVL